MTMGRYTTAYTSLLARLVEVEILRKHAADQERTDPVQNRHEVNALCRGAIVLLCAHLEAFIRELGDVALGRLYERAVPRRKLAPQLYYYMSKDILDEVKDTSQPTKLADKLFWFLDNDAAMWGRKGPLPGPVPAERFNKGFASPAYKKIQRYFKRFGYSGYRNDLAVILKGDYSTTTNMVDHLVDIRNKIAHGDTTATETPADIKEMVHIVRRFCAVSDGAFASWFKREMCCIR